jgi:hypothetical protein
MLFSFALWTISEGIFNTMHKTAAAKGMDVFDKRGTSLITTSLATIPIIFCFYFFYDLAYTPMLVAYTLEILPYKIRAKGFAVMVFAVFVPCTSGVQSVAESHSVLDFGIQPIRKSVGSIQDPMALLPGIYMHFFCSSRRSHKYAGISGMVGTRAYFYLVLCRGDQRFVICVLSLNTRSISMSRSHFGGDGDTIRRR